MLNFCQIPFSSFHCIHNVESFSLDPKFGGGKQPKVSCVCVLSLFLHIYSFIYSEDTEAGELLDGAESQNYGYGYGTKVI